MVENSWKTGFRGRPKDGKTISTGWPVSLAARQSHAQHSPEPASPPPPDNSPAPGPPRLQSSGKEVTNARVRAVVYGSEELSQGRAPRGGR